MNNAPPLRDKTTGLYIHIPFCESKCPYCDFNSYACKVIPEAEYIDCLIGELDYYDRNSSFSKQLESIYFGGGTPSIFSPKGIKRIVNKVTKRFFPLTGLEVTIEANPSSLTRGKLLSYLSAGVNRLSLGVQSFADSDLSVLGRLHNATQAIRAFELAREAGFTNIGMDLIFAVPGQGLDGFRQNLLKVVELSPEHISVYGLTAQEGTPFYDAFISGSLKPVDEETDASMFELAGDILTASGYRHYEISNYCKPGFSAVHNSRYWLGKDYLGLGAGAHSYLDVSGKEDVRRWWNHKDVQSYMRSIQASGDAVEAQERLSKEARMLEALYLGLRLLEGLDRGLFMAKFDIDPVKLLAPRAFDNGLVLFEGDTTLKITQKGLLFSNELF